MPSKGEAMSSLQQLISTLERTQFTWLITGVAGFIGSNLLETLLKYNQKVIGLDNFSTGYRHNLTNVQEQVLPSQWDLFEFIEGDIRDLSVCQTACKGVDFVLHQAALGSVPRSISDPIASHATNVDGSLNMLVAANEANVKRFVYASSSSVYGDHKDLPKVEEKIGKPLSPYAVTKLVNEQYADVFSKVYGLESIGLRYFNAFGQRQDPNSVYAAVLPLWTSSLINGKPLYINGDGSTSRDFCYIDNVVQVNLLSAMTTNKDALNQVYNVAVGEQTTLNELLDSLVNILQPDFPELANFEPTYRDFRAGDVKHSLADISKAKSLLGYEPTHTVATGLPMAVEWYKANLVQSEKNLKKSA